MEPMTGLEPVTSSLPRKCSTTELHWQESGKRDSNSRPQPWQGCALPTELFPQHVGVPGFEPGTLCSQSRCANRTALHPDFDKGVCGERGIRTPGTLIAFGSLANYWFKPLTHLSLRQAHLSSLLRNPFRKRCKVRDSFENRKGCGLIFCRQYSLREAICRVIRHLKIAVRRRFLGRGGAMGHHCGLRQPS